MVENAGTPLLGQPPLVTCPLPRLPTAPGWRPSRLVLRASSFGTSPPQPPKMEAAATGTTPPAQALDLAQFGQWLVEHQMQLMREVVGQQEHSQAVLLHELTQSWKPADAPPASGGGALGRSPWPLLTKLGDSDDREAYLEAFERTAEAAKWPPEQLSFFLEPYLSGEALAALKALDKAEAADYKQLKKAILDQYEITTESYRQCLRVPTLPEGARRRAVVARLKDATTCWLKLTTEDGRCIVEQIVIEQLLLILPGRTRHWLACWQPEQLADFLKLWKHFVAAEGQDAHSRREETWGKGTGPQMGPRPPPDLRGRARSGNGRLGFKGRGPTPNLRNLPGPSIGPRRMDKRP